MRAIRVRPVVSLFALLTLAGVGCQKSDTGEPPPPAAVAARGKVVYNRAPFPNATVVFYKDEGSETARGTTDANGAFTLTTYQDNDGVPAGEYKVTVSIDAGDGADGEPEGTGAAGRASDSLPEKYTHPETTPLKVTVTEARGNNFTLELK